MPPGLVNNIVPGAGQWSTAGEITRSVEKPSLMNGRKLPSRLHLPHAALLLCNPLSKVAGHWWTADQAGSSMWPSEQETNYGKDSALQICGHGKEKHEAGACGIYRSTCAIWLTCDLHLAKAMNAFEDTRFSPR